MTHSTYEQMTTAQLTRTLPYVSNSVYRTMILDVLARRQDGTGSEPTRLPQDDLDAIALDVAFDRSTDF